MRLVYTCCVWLSSIGIVHGKKYPRTSLVALLKLYGFKAVRAHILDGNILLQEMCRGTRF